jgi:hypothetical protein
MILEKLLISEFEKPLYAISRRKRIYVHRVHPVTAQPFHYLFPWINLFQEEDLSISASVNPFKSNPFKSMAEFRVLPETLLENKNEFFSIVTDQPSLIRFLKTYGVRKS